MNKSPLKITYVGGPTALLEYGGVRLLTDPTFDPPGGEYKTGPVTLRKTEGPAIGVEELRHDIVLLSHDHHADNLDQLGRVALGKAQKVLTTEAGAARLGGNAVGLAHWASVTIPSGDGRSLTVTATPARHGPAHMDRGPVVGFILQSDDAPQSAVYVSGDTVWYEGVAEIGARFRIHCAILFMGAAQVAEIGPFPLTMTAADGLEFARAFPDSEIVPLHFAGWQHFSESRLEITAAFQGAGLENRLHWIEPRQTIEI